MQAERSHKNFIALAILLLALVVLVYLVFESRHRSDQIDKALKQLPSTAK